MTDESRLQRNIQIQSNLGNLTSAALHSCSVEIQGQDEGEDSPKLSVNNFKCLFLGRTYSKHGNLPPLKELWVTIDGVCARKEKHYETRSDSLILHSFLLLNKFGQIC